ncbi:hypothetical protein Scep_019795 [Stephania cephalantha]|uniref:Uncharacterized protein n=1 Tax=Stephania cephalantha TaxID=152367 RepID=A0AAP0ICE9_9MAGN
MTITLQDVQIILGLPVDGLPITGRVDQDYDALCFTQLGFPFPKITDLRADSNSATFKVVSKPPDNANDVEVQRYARAYIPQLLGEHYLRTSRTTSFTSHICNFWKISRLLDKIRLG